MAVEKKPASWFKRISKKMDTLDTSMDSLYQSTYSSRSDNRKDMDRIVTSIDDTIDRIINNGEGQKISDISNLYVRIQKKRGVSNQSIVNSAMELFSDNAILNSLSINQEVTKYIQAEDYQYDMVCKYMPSIETALDIKKDNVLSSDNFTKDFLNIQSSSTSNTTFAIFNDRARAAKEKYKFQDICEEMYKRASRYGECFLYIVPYSIALDRLIKRRNTFGSTGLIKTFAENSFVLEGAELKDDNLKQALKNANIDVSECKVNVIFDDHAIFSEAIQARESAEKILSKTKQISLTEAFNVIQEAKVLKEEGKDEEASIKYDSVFTKHKSSDTLDGGINDGLIVRGAKNNSEGKVQDMNGCVVSFIERADIIPVYIDELCVGYYHFNISTTDTNVCIHGNPTGTMAGIGGRNTTTNIDLANDMLINYIAQNISNSIDTHFINSNKDLKEEIYAILKYNDKFNALNGVSDITVSFLPVDDVYHFFLEQDRRTHRGISSIRKSLVPAMLYCLLYLTNTIGQITRSQDKRIYYVKQNVETNVARTLMNVINQIKKGNMGMRQIESMNNILNIVGKYNDHVIPMGQSGDAPIQFEVMQGQDIQTPTELMERFENSAVESTDVPYEFVQSVNQVDYATRFSMSNSKFLRKIYKEQRICQDAFSAIFTKIYNYEYGENEKMIRVLLPAPAFLTMTNTQQLIENTRNYVNAIVETEIPNESDEVKAEFTKIMTRNYLGSYIDYSKVDEVIAQAKMNTSINKDDDEA